MSSNLQLYTSQIRQALNLCLCLRDFPHELVEKHNKPEIEVFSMDQANRALIQNPIYIARDEKEKCLIETSINSCRVIIGQNRGCRWREGFWGVREVILESIFNNKYFFL
jgi:actin related protein 2/3 complex subunit 4